MWEYYKQSLAGVIKTFTKKKPTIVFGIWSLCDIKRSIKLQIFYRKVLTMLQTESFNRSRNFFLIRQLGHSFCCLHSEKCTLLWLIYRITASFQEIPANWISIIVLTSHILCYANSVVNPFIYNFMSGVYEKNSNLFIIIYIFVETKIQSLLLCLFTSTNDAIEYERM